MSFPFFTCESLAEALKYPALCYRLRITSLKHSLQEYGPAFTKLARLRVLHLQGDYTIYQDSTFRLPAEIGQLKHLQHLTLLNLPIAKWPDWISELTALRYLVVRGTDIVEVPGSIRSLQKLHTLRVENCPLQKLPSELREMKRIKDLGLCDTRLTDLSPTLFPPTLRSLNFSGTGCYNPHDMAALHAALPSIKIYPPLSGIIGYP